MGKKKTKTPDAKARKAEKAAKQEKKATKKSAKTQDDTADADDVDIDAVLEEYTRQQALFHKVTETVLDAAPPARTNASLVPSPTNSNELLLFGGESFNGSRAMFFNDLFAHAIDRNEWRHITSPNSPLPRSGHWMVSGRGAVWLFGGEFSSPKQGTFYHYGDFWRLDTASREWEKIEGKKGQNPGARSGHRMVVWKNFILLFGGFQDTSQNTKYLNDLWVFDTTNYTWTAVNPLLPAHAQKPEARSGFSFLPHEAGAVLYGGYARVKGTTGGKGSGEKASGKKKGGSSNAQRVVLKPMFFQDTWFLRMNTTPSLIRWERRKKPVNSPNPPRVGVSMTYHKGRGIMFGGVHDVEDSEEGIDSSFFNDLFAYAIDRNRFFTLQLRRPRQNQNKRVAGGGRNRAQEDADELLETLKKLQAAAPTEEEMDELIPRQKEEEVKQVKENSYTLPHPRFDTALAVQGDILFIYGGRYEKGDKEDREVTFDEMFAINLEKLDGVREVFSRGATADWEASDDEEEEGEDDEDEDESEEEEEEEEQEVKAPKIDEAELEKRRKEKEEKKKKKRQGSVSEPAKEDEDIAEVSKEEPKDEGEAEEESSTLDKTPHPRPFESLREFFTRTANEWQEYVIALQEQKNSWYGAEPTKRTAKEYRKEAFALAEEKWWATREEIRELEDEREEAGIGEVVNLAETAAAGGGGGARRR